MIYFPLFCLTARYTTTPVKIAIMGRQTPKHIATSFKSLPSAHTFEQAGQLGHVLVQAGHTEHSGHTGQEPLVFTAHSFIPKADSKRVSLQPDAQTYSVPVTL